MSWVQVVAMNLWDWMGGFVQSYGYALRFFYNVVIGYNVSAFIDNPPWAGTFLGEGALKDVEGRNFGGDGYYWRLNFSYRIGDTR